MVDVLQLQRQLARSIAEEIRIELKPDEQRRLADTRHVNPEAYLAYLKGRSHLNMRSAEGTSTAAEYFQQALALDPAFAPAYSGLSDSYRLSTNARLNPGESLPKAEAAARRALALDDGLSEAHASLAGVLFRYYWNWGDAEREFQRSLSLDPNYAEGYRAYAVFLLMMRRHEEALTMARSARAQPALSGHQ